MSEDLQSILAKVKKLLKLAEGKANPEESASAAAKAQELIDKYKLEISTAEETEEQILGTTLTTSKQKVWWQLRLAIVIAKANSCKAFAWTLKDYGGKKTLKEEIRMIGTKPDMEIVRYLFPYLCREINKLTKAAINRLDLDGEDYGVKPKQYGNSFRLGCVEAISIKLNEQKQRLHQEYKGSMALVRLDQQLARVEKFAEDLGLKKAKSQAKILPDGYRYGKLAGSQIPINKGLKGGSDARAIGEGRKLLG